MNFRLLAIHCILFAAVWMSCSDNENQGNGSLTFSHDTIQFFIVYSDQGSPTQRFKIYNRSGEKLNIESIELIDANRYGFSLVMDGEQGTSFSDMEIANKDSLQGFVQINLPSQLQDTPVTIVSSIRFRVGGKTQSIYLKASGQDVYVFTNKTIEQDTTLTGKKPILINGILKVNSGATLRMEANTRLLFSSKSALKIDGKVEIVGTTEHPVVMTNNRTDLMDNSIPYPLVPGQWEGVRFSEMSYENAIENLQICNSIYGLTFDESDVQKQKADLKNVIVQNSSQSGVQMVNCKIDAENCLFANSGGAALTILGGNYSFIHCTVANYYNWGVRKSSALQLGNTYNAKAYPLWRCHFVNSIVYGSYTNELDINILSSESSVFQFTNCLIKGKEQSGSKFVNVAWNLDPLFADNGNANGLTFDLRLTEQSPARGKADKSYSLLVPTDLYGYNRLNNNQPDLGCAEFISK